MNPFQAVMQTETVGRQTLVNLENGTSYGHKVPIQTAAELVELYWPDITLKDFLESKSKVVLRFVRRPG